MNLKTQTISFLFLLTTFASFGQEIIGTSGGTDSIANAEVSWSIGEAIIETATVGSTDITQGFVQPSFTIVSVEEKNLNNWNVSIFPNPAKNYFSVSLSEFSNQELIVKISAINGQLVKELLLTSNNQEVFIDELLPATYTVEILSSNGKYYQNLRLVKTH